jgi:glycosyltransferase involved in cell wall biosynthesis
MKILILTQHYWPESFRINEVAVSLQQNGCAVTVLTGQPNYPDGNIFPGYRASSISEQGHDGYTIYRVPLIPRGRGNAIRLILNYLSFLLSASIIGPWLLRREQFDVVFVYGTSPILQAIPGIVIKKLKKAKLVTWVQDLWPESLEATGFVRNRHLLKSVELIVRWIYRRNDLLLAQSKAFLPSIREMSGEAPVEYHPNPGELAFNVRELRTEPQLKLSPGFNIVFAGNLGTVQALETVLEAAQQLQTHNDIRFVLVGSGSRSGWIQQELLRLGLKNVLLVGRFEPAAMPPILAQASALLVSLVRSPIMSLTVPSKIQAYLAAGRPIIAALDGEGARVVDEAGAGVSCPAENATALTAAVLTLYARSLEDLNAMGEAGRCYYKKHFEPGLLAQQLTQRFRKLTSNPNI